MIWYLLICSVLMVVQSRLEAHFGRGFGTSGPSDNGFRARMLSMVGGSK